MKTKGSLNRAVQIRNEIVEFNPVVAFSGLKFCCCIRDGNEIHSYIIEEGLENNTSSRHALVAMYIRCGCIEDAESVYLGLKTSDKFSLARILSGYNSKGYYAKALQLFGKHTRGELDSIVLICLLKSCSEMGALAQGKVVHAFIVEERFDSDQVIGNALVDMYAKCSTLFEAYNVFTSLPKRDIVSWCTLISRYVDYGCMEEALCLFDRMQADGIEPNRVTFLSLLKACASLLSIKRGRQMHINLSKQGLDADLFIASALVDMYSKCHLLEDACCIFDSLQAPNVVSCSALISGYIDHGKRKDALLLFNKMQDKDIDLDKHMYKCVIRGCVNIMTSCQGKVLHIDITKKGFDMDDSVNGCLVGMHLKFGNINDALKIFGLMHVRNIYVWSSLISGYMELGYRHKAFALLKEMMKEGINPEVITFVELLKACSLTEEWEQGKLVHFEIMIRGLEINSLIFTFLLDMYAKCGKLHDAYHVFHSIQTREVFLWNTMISRYANSGLTQDAFIVFRHMQVQGIQINRVTALCILKTCSNQGLLAYGWLIHTGIVLVGIDRELSVGNALIDMYAECGSLEDAQQVFNILKVKDVVSWSAIINLHSEHGRAKDALELYMMIQNEHIEPNEVTFVCVLNAISKFTDMHWILLLHHQIIECCVESNLHVAGSLIEAYANSGSLDDAHQVFDITPGKNVVLWSTMISLCVKHGYEHEVHDLLAKMYSEGVEPNKITYIHALDAIIRMGCLEVGKYYHVELSKKGFDLDLFVGNTLLGMYVKCGSLAEACEVFDGLAERTLVSWNALISGVADHGNFHLLGMYLDKMQMDGIAADNVTLLSLLSSCTHGGHLEEGCALLQNMENCEVVLSLEHYISITDMLGRCGLLIEAEETTHKMPFQPHWLSWLTVLASCAKYSDIDIARCAFSHLLGLNFQNDSAFLLMSNIYSANGMWQDAKEVRGLWKGG